jgi:hypothetical protein
VRVHSRAGIHAVATASAVGTGFETVQARNRREPTSCGLSLRTRGSHIRLVWPILFGRYAWICPRISAWAALAYVLCKKKKKEMAILSRCWLPHLSRMAFLEEMPGWTGRRVSAADARLCTCDHARSVATEPAEALAGERSSLRAMS